MTVHLRPTTGTLKARLFENTDAGVPLSIFFDITIPVEPFNYRGSSHRTALRLEFIALPVRDWRDLAGRDFEFPVNPEPGYIDGSIYLENVHNPVDVIAIRFGEFDEQVMPISLQGVIDFTYEGPAELGIVRFDWSTNLTLNSGDLDRVFTDARSRKVL